VTLKPGQMLAHYRLVEQIGQGGMGVVWKAEDTTLDRAVAIKILPPEFAADQERVARFEREARVVAALQHPNIAAVFSVHKEEDLHYLALELVAGEDLSQILTQGPLPLDEAIAFARQIAEALEAAHQAGVVHRDLKPANVKVTPDGRVKVLDFGLAKFSAGAASGGSGDPVSLSPTITAGTKAGVIMGTAPYMSPEQAKGKPVDRRTDLWAFGAILWEMLTGRRLFPGEATSEILAEILKTDPDFRALPPGTPAGIRRLLRRCLTRDPRSRLHDAADARLELEEAASGDAEADHGNGPPGSPATAPSPARAWLARVPWILSGILAFAFIMAMNDNGQQTAPVTPAMTFGVPTLEKEVLPDDELQMIDLSQDGRDLVFIGVGEESRWVYHRPLHRMEARRIPGTEGAAGVQLSPDNRWVAFVSEGRLLKIPIEGGTPIFLAETPANRGVNWGADGVIVLAPSYNSGIVRVPALGGPAETITTPDQTKGERSHRWPQILPGGRWVLFTVGMVNSPGDYDASNVDAVNLHNGTRKRVLEGARMARFVPPDRILFQRDASLLSMKVDPETMEVSGTPVSLTEGVGGESSSGVGYWAAAANGTLAYVPQSAVSNQRKLVLVDQDGSETTLPLPPDSYWHPRFDPSGRRIAFSIGSGGGADDDVWVYDLSRERLDRLTFGSRGGIPCWSPDGTRIAYARGGTGTTGIFWKEADGSGAEEALLMNSQGLVRLPDAFTPGARSLLFTQVSGSLSIQTVSLSPPGEPATLLSGYASALSPDGRYVAYTGTTGATYEVFVSQMGGDGGRWQVSAAGGKTPVWSRDGTQLYFNRDNEILAAKVTTEPAFRSDRPRVLFKGPYHFPSDPSRNFDVDAEGRFILLRRHIEDSSRNIHILTGWKEKAGKG
jgi:Tol biopolymer transport system component